MPVRQDMRRVQYLRHDNSGYICTYTILCLVMKCHVFHSFSIGVIRLIGDNMLGSLHFFCIGKERKYIADLNTTVL